MKFNILLSSTKSTKKPKIISCYPEILHRNDQFCDLGKYNFLPRQENQVFALKA